MLDFGPEVQQQFPMPVTAHRPGRTEHPTANLRAPVQSSLSVVVTAQNWQRHDAYLYGFVLYRSRYYWEAHEIWEPVWLTCAPNSLERLMLQACIQLANAALKEELGNTKAALRLYGISADLLREIVSRQTGERAQDVLLGIDVRELIQKIELKTTQPHNL